jgi:DNA mismatch repair ATPase MutS
MKAFLMHRDRDFDLDRERPWNAQDLTQDLELETLFGAMAGGDPFLLDVARKAVLSSLKDPAEIVYRQAVLADCVRQPAIVEALYALAVEAIQGERKIWRGSFHYPDATLHSSVEAMQLFVGVLRKVRAIADEHAGEFQSDGFTALFAMLKRELDDEYFRRVDDHLEQLRFRRGVLISARLGKGSKGIDYVLRRPGQPAPGWRQWFSFMDRSAFTLVIADRDENGARALTELRGRGIDLAANALAQSADHILSFFVMLRAELGFYIGCLRLRRRLAEKGEPVCFPEPVAPGRFVMSGRGLYDPCLSLSLDGRVVGNDVNADGKSLLIITGANQGGKSTFLRSAGLAQLMMQAGMFVAAEAFRSTVCDALFTHYKREEDPTMKSGKLDEELSRMSEIADRITPNCVVLFNESFAATNEREGAEIAGAIVRALLETGIRVFFVTHSFELAHGFYRQGMDTALFLLAGREPDGSRTFKLAEGEPLPTSYGEDLYREIFVEPPEVVRDEPEGMTSVPAPR